MIAWLKRAWAWVSLALGLAVVALFGLWRRSARQAADERERAEAAAASAERERKVLDLTRAIEAKAAAKRAEIEARAEVAATAAEVAETELRASVETAGSAADEVNRRMDARGQP